MMRLLSLLLYGCLIGCAEVKPSWGGNFVGIQNVSSTRSGPGHAQDVSVYDTAIIRLGEKNSLQLQISEPALGGSPYWRVAVDRRIF